MPVLEKPVFESAGQAKHKRMASTSPMAMTVLTTPELGSMN